MEHYRVGIIGAGLAGLSLSIQLAKAGYDVVLFEKYQFPFHKLCGEYLSRESLSFLGSLGLDMGSLNPAQINRLEITNVSGSPVVADLPLGGVGLSRWKMDYELYQLATSAGVHVVENAQVTSTENIGLKNKITTKNGVYTSDVLIAAYGKKSNLAQRSSKNEYLGVKYHVKYAHQPKKLISMHNFQGGYCGVCRLESDWVSLCYLSSIGNLNGANISEMEEQVLFKNENIRRIFAESEKVYEKPIVVSNIHFHKKELISNGIFNVGDSAGLITPLCGNGMSMALHGSYILAKLLLQYLSGKLERAALEKQYQTKWDRAFKRRMAAGRTIQKVFRKERNAKIAMRLMNSSSLIKRTVISMTHGSDFFNKG